MRMTIGAIVVILSVANVGLADTFDAGGANEFTIDFVNISGDTNPASGKGIVDYDYRMGTYEITNDQWNKFTNIYGVPTGFPSDAYSESAYWTGANVPTNNVSWNEVAQFVNWLNTSTGHQIAYKFVGETSFTFTTWSPTDAGYNPDNPLRNSNAMYFLPTEHEWEKAAYWNGAALQTYATIASESLHQGDGNNGTGWNYHDYDDDYATDPIGPWDVGSGSEELNGTYDMMGNVMEWMESPYAFIYGSYRPYRGGSFETGIGALLSTNRATLTRTCESETIGFRVASVPEPTVIKVAVDIKPQACPNPLNVKSKGVLPVAISGSGTVDVYDIDIDSIQLAGVSPLRGNYEDVATPLVDPIECECSTEGPDGYIDLTLKFEIQAIADALGEAYHGEEFILYLTGYLYDGTPIEGSDCIIIRRKGRR